MEILRLDGLCKQYPAFRLDNVSFSMGAGTIMGLIGRNGAGKTTTLKSMLHLVHPDAGKITICGLDMDTDERAIRSRIGFVSGGASYYQRKRLRELTDVTKDFYPGWDGERYARLVRQFSLDERKRVCELSEGMKVKYQLAVAMSHKAELLILDEPTSQLDPIAASDFLATLGKINRELGTTIILTEHRLEEAFSFASRVAVMDGGRLLTVNRTKALFADPGSVPAAMLTGCKNIAPAIKRGEHEVYVPDWGVSLSTAQPVGDDIKAIGIRAHYFNPSAPTNRHEIEYLDEMEEPFEWIIEFKFKSAAESAPSVWWRVTKDKRPQLFPAELGIAPANILLLY